MGYAWISPSGDLDGEVPGGELVFLDVLGEVKYGRAARLGDPIKAITPDERPPREWAARAPPRPHG